MTSDNLHRPTRVSVIGSFRKFYPEVLDAIRTFERVGLTVGSPMRSRIVDPTQRFVRFESDPSDSQDAEIQRRALQAILSSDFVFVINPGGYVGNTTCYEIGRIHERRIPLYFYETPADLPIAVPDLSIIKPVDLASLIERGSNLPKN